MSSLGKYNQKRNFKSTAEPRGLKMVAGGPLTFVVQQHAASHLHYDFRLELEGVLKSWAVPKGPSMNPDDKRLAMMVEDHPYSYKDFEGNIPEGNYGAGNVIVWDNGTYAEISQENKKDGEKKLLAGLKKGHISFLLAGKKLKGEFSLVKLQNGKQENAWLLIKKNDKYASTTDVLSKNKSVISRKTLEQLQKKAKSSSEKKKAPEKKKSKTSSPKLPAPEEVEPMLAQVRDEPFNDEHWIFEIKYDGYRTLAIVNDEKVELISRNHLSFNKKFKEVAEELKNLDHPAVLDGEVVVEDEKGRSHFQLLQNHQKTGEGTLKYYVFDMLNLDGHDLCQLPLAERKKLLKMLLDKAKLNRVIYSGDVKTEGKAFYQLAIKNKLEGIIAKDARSPYRSGRRSGEWLKIKINNEEEAIIIGFTMPRGSRSHFGSLLLGQYRNNKLHYIGHCGTGFSDETLKELYTKLKPHFISHPPIKEKIKVNSPAQWVKPKLVCQVKFTEWTKEGQMRHPVFLGLRIDKKPNEVEKQTTVKKDLNGKSDLDLKIGKIVLHLTNQQKVYFPEDGITKGDIVNYYKEIATVMLPYLKNRPESMNRHPNGINNPGFYQKDVDVAKSPAWITTKKVYSDSNKEYIDYLICNDKATLVYMANLGCIEINPWNSTIDNPDNPDWLIIDLDPEEIDFSEVVKTALKVKDVFDELETPSYCKTSGATGLHIYVPLAAKYEYSIVRKFANVIAQMVHEELPGITSIERSPSKRKHKVYIDFLQNSRGQTLAAPYSVRPKRGATVSTPLEWKEVNAKLNPANFTIKNILNRLDKKGDLWKPVIGKGVDLQKIIKKIANNTKSAVL